MELPMTFLRRCTALLVSCSLAFGGVAHASPGSGLIGTEQAATVMKAASLGEAQSRLTAALDRADLAAMLQARGVSVDSLRERVAALTDDEARQLVAQIDAAPAGADVLGLLFTVFIILLVTDILGLTKVFPFTRLVR
jgi:hypothetical protein